MARRRIKTTKLDIIRYATGEFLDRGYSASSAKLIADALDIATGNLTYYFPTKEHLLAELVDMLCDFQRKMMEYEADEGISSILGICLELAAMAAICDTDPVARDFYTAAYASPMCLAIIRKNDMARAKEVFRDYCPDWTEEQFAEAEALVSGIEYATLMTGSDSISLPTRISGAINAILQIYQIPEDIRAMKIQKVLGMDYCNLARRILDGFKEYVEITNQQALEDLYRQANVPMPSV